MFSGNQAAAFLLIMAAVPAVLAADALGFPLSQHDFPRDFPREPRYMFRCWDVFDEDDGCVGEIYVNLPNRRYDFNFTGPCCQHILNVAGDLQIGGRRCWPQVLTELGVPLEFTDRVQTYCEYKVGGWRRYRHGRAAV